MTSRLRLIVLAGLATLAAALAVGVAGAAAHGGPGFAFGGSVSSLVTQAATQLGVTRAKLVTAIRDSADARISAAVDDGDIAADRADDLKAEVDDNLHVAYVLSETKTVASNLGITTTTLNNGFRAVRKALLTAQIVKALAAGRVTA